MAEETGPVLVLRLGSGVTLSLLIGVCLCFYSHGGIFKVSLGSLPMDRRRFLCPEVRAGVEEVR